MNVYKFNIKKNIKDNYYFKDGSFLLLGKFEVFHKGHEELLKWAIKNKKDEKLGILLIEKNENNNIQSLENKLNNLYQLKFDFVIIADFNFEFKSIDGLDFIKYLDHNFNVKQYIIGQDFRFGKDRKYQGSDISKISNTKVEIIPILRNSNIKISSSLIKEMHELGEYNYIKYLISNPLVFNIKISNKMLKWDEENINKPHFGNYYFKILIDGFWYCGVIRFSIDENIYYELLNFPIDNNIFDQKSKIRILDIERIIINNRFDDINENDIFKAKQFFQKHYTKNKL